MDFSGTIENGGLLFPSVILEQRKQYLQSMKDGTDILERISKVRSPKTKRQLATIFGHMMDQTILQANENGVDSSGLLVFLLDGSIPKGVPITKDLLYNLLYLICPTTDDDGKKVTLSSMDVKQASELFENFRRIMAPLGIVISDPDPRLRR